MGAEMSVPKDLPCRKLNYLPKEVEDLVVVDAKVAEDVVEVAVSEEEVDPTSEEAVGNTARISHHRVRKGRAEKRTLCHHITETKALAGRTVGPKTKPSITTP